MKQKLSPQAHRVLRRLAIPGVIMVAGYVGMEYGKAAILAKTEASKEAYNAVESELGKARKAAKRLKEGTAMVENRLDDYKRIQEEGVFNPPQRLEAASMLENMGVQQKLVAVRYAFLPSKTTTVFGDKIRDSLQINTVPITISLDAVTDRDIFAFLDDVKRDVGGRIILRNLNLTRAMTDNASAIQALREGRRPVLVSAEATIDWLSYKILDAEATEKLRDQESQSNSSSGSSDDSSQTEGDG